MEQKGSKVRDGFSTGIGALLAMVGSAIGIGNVIKFPAITGNSGGSAFIIIYTICLLLAGIPVLISELFIGKRAKKNTVDSFSKAGNHKVWGLNGWFGAIGILILMPYYSLFASWVLRFGWTSLSGGLNNVVNVTQGANIFSSFLSSGEAIFWQLGFLILLGIVLSFGIKKGIEKAVKILAPIFIIIVLIIVIRGIFSSGAGASISFLTTPDFSKITTGVILTALGLSFFKLSLGIGAMVTYGSFSGRKLNVFSSGFKIAFIDLAASLLIGFAVFAGFFSGNSAALPNIGFSLLFVSLPILFNGVAFGQVILTLFFILTAIVAFTASLSLVQVPVTVLEEKFKIKRPIAVWSIIVVIAVIGILPALGDSLLKGVNGHMVIMFGSIYKVGFVECFDFVVSNIIMPVSGLFTAILIGYVFTKDKFKKEISNDGEFKVKKGASILKVVLKITPILIFIIFLDSLGILPWK